MDGRIRKYYWITARGRRALASARIQIIELMGEVLEPQRQRPRAKMNRR